MASSSAETMITLRSSDYVPFDVKKSVAVMSTTIKNLIDDGISPDDPIPLPNLDSQTLSMVLEFMNKHAHEESSNSKELKDFDERFVDKEAHELFDLVFAANYLEVKELIVLVCEKIADTIKEMTPEQVREFFKIDNDFTPEEEAVVRQENAWAFETTNN